MTQVWRLIFLIKDPVFILQDGEEKNDFKKAIKKVYKELKKKDSNWKTRKIKARFICALSISYLNKKIACEIGIIEGTICERPKGKNGFGYDPIFIPKNKKKDFW